MSVTIDSLDIQIRSSAGSAAKNINDLADSLDKLNGSAKVTKIVNSLGRLNDTLTTLRSNSGVMGQLSSLSQSLAKLGSIPEMTGLKSAVKELRKLPKVMGSLRTTEIAAFTAQMKLLASGLEPLAKQIDVIGKGFSKLPSQVSKCVTAVKRLDSANKSAAKSTRSHGEALNNQSFNLLATYEHLSNVFSMIHGIQDGFAKLLSDAMQWDGITFQFGRAFGEHAEMVLDYADKVSEALLINKQQFMESASLYGSLLKGFGVEQKQVTTMAVGLAELSYDIWAAYNNRYRTLDDASEAVRSAITGEIEPIRNAGIALTEASMQEYLDSIGMAHVSMEKLTEAQKSEVRYATMVNAAMNQGIIGTYAREMETAEGAVRTLTQQLRTLGQAIGSLFIPMLKVAVPWLTAFVQLVTEGVIALGALFGINFQEITWGNAKGMAKTAEGAGATADALGDAAKSAKAMKDYTMGFDELNIIDPSSGSGGSGAGAAGVGGGSLGLDLDTLWDDAVFASASKQVDELKQKIKGYANEHKLMLSVVAGTAGFLTFMKVLRGLNSLLGITKTIGNLKTAFTGLGKASTGLGAALGAVTGWFKNVGSGLKMLKAGTLTVKDFLLGVTGTAPAIDFITKLGATLKTAITKLPGILVNAVKAIPVWGWIVTAIVSAITLAVVDFDFTDIGYKFGHALGAALKKAWDLFLSAGEFVVKLAEGLNRAIQSAVDWVRDNFKDKSVFEIGAEIVNGLWEGIKNGWNNFWGNVSELIDGFVQGIKDALGIHSPSTVFAEIGVYIIQGLLNGIVVQWEVLKAWFTANVAPKFTKEFWAAKWENARKGTIEKLTAIKTAIAGKWGEVTTWFKQNVSTKLTAQYWRVLFDGIRQGVAQKMSDVKQSIVTKWDETKAWFNNNVASKLTLNYWTSKFANIGSGLKTSIKNGVNSAIEVLNKFIDWVNKNMTWTIDPIKILGVEVFPGAKISLANIPRIPKFADGGFPNIGQMFIAREAGPELVGSINGRTAVANNDQIVAAVAQGVYEAVVSAMSGNYGSGNQSINVYLDGKQITAAVEKRQNERGMQLIGNQLGFA